jgi:hypothetical protein
MGTENSKEEKKDLRAIYGNELLGAQESEGVVRGTAEEESCKKRTPSNGEGVRKMLQKRTVFRLSSNVGARVGSVRNAG